MLATLSDGCSSGISGDRRSFRPALARHARSSLVDTHQTDARPICPGGCVSLLAHLRTHLRRQVSKYLSTAPVAVCECNAWENFLIHAMYPNANRIAIHPGEPAARVASAIGRATRVALMHVDVSRTV